MHSGPRDIFSGMNFVLTRGGTPFGLEIFLGIAVLTSSLRVLPCHVMCVSSKLNLGGGELEGRESLPIVHFPLEARDM